MSPTDGDAASRLESALADVFAGAPTLPGRDRELNDTVAAPPPASDDWGVDEPDDGPVPIPEIVPATTHPPADPVHPPTALAPARTAPTTAPTPPASAPAGSPPVTSWGDHMTNLPANAQGAALRAPGRRPRVRRVTRVLRHIDPWSTFKVGLLFSVVAYLVTLTSGVLLWRVADSTGTLDNVERWFTQFGWETFELKGGEIFHNAWIIGLFGAVGLTGALVLLATLFNLVSDIVGGVRLTVLEEEVVERTVSSTRRYVVRRTPTAGADAIDDWDVDDDPSPRAVADPASGSASAGPTPAQTATTTPTTAAADGDWSVDDDEDDDAGFAPAAS